MSKPQSTGACYVCACDILVIVSLARAHLAVKLSVCVCVGGVHRGVDRYREVWFIGAIDVMAPTSGAHGLPSI